MRFIIFNIMEFDDETNSHRINPSYARIYYNYDTVLIVVVKQPPPSSIPLLLFYLFKRLYMKIGL